MPYAYDILKQALRRLAAAGYNWRTAGVSPYTGHTPLMTLGHAMTHALNTEEEWERILDA